MIYVSVCPTAHAQANSTAVELLRELEGTPSYKRSEVVTKIVELSSEAVPALTDALEKFEAGSETNYIANCVLALGEIGPEARGATAQLQELLDAGPPQIKYAAAKAIGQIWKNTDINDSVREINASLLAAAYTTRGAARYAPLLAIYAINTMDIPVTRRESPNQEVISLNTNALLNKIAEWLNEHPDHLPALSEWPWPMLVQKVEQSPQEDSEAFDVLSQKRPLPAVDTILSELKDEDVEPNQWNVLGKLLDNITGIEFDAPFSENGSKRKEELEEWQTRWIEHVAQQTEESYRLYTWRKLENAIDMLHEDPSAEQLKQITLAKELVIKQFQSLEDIPASARPEARLLVEEELQLKAETLSTIEKLVKEDKTITKLQLAKQLLELVQSDTGRRIANQRLKELVDLARQEEKTHLLKSYSNLLSHITGVPIQLDFPGIEQRNATLDKWWEEVNK
jgi:hypothetical protein